MPSLILLTLAEHQAVVNIGQHNVMFVNAALTNSLGAILSLVEELQSALDDTKQAVGGEGMTKALIVDRLAKKPCASKRA